MEERTIGSILKSAREREGFTLRFVEEIGGISNAYLSQLENDKIKKPSAIILYKLSDFYGINFDALMVAAGFVDKKLPKSTEKYAYVKVPIEFEAEVLAYLDYLKHRRK